jgi:hypothetical protein
MPLDAEYNGPDINSKLDCANYQKTYMVHVLRPRFMGWSQSRALRKLASLVRQNHKAIREADQLNFNKDYLTPIFARTDQTPGEAITQLGHVLRQDGTVEGEYSLYCSEFIWMVQSLARRGSWPEWLRKSGRWCYAYKPIPMIGKGKKPGLAEGPLWVLRALDKSVDTEAKRALVQELFTDGDAAKLSDGHLKVAEQVAPLMVQLKRHYLAAIDPDSEPEAAAPDTPDIDTIREAIRKDFPPNYSPTAFLINTFLPRRHRDREYDYLYTLAFVTAEDYEKGLELAPEGR